MFVSRIQQKEHFVSTMKTYLFHSAVLSLKKSHYIERQMMVMAYRHNDIFFINKSCFQLDVTLEM